MHSFRVLHQPLKSYNICLLHSGARGIECCSKKRDAQVHKALSLVGTTNASRTKKQYFGRKALNHLIVLCKVKVSYVNTAIARTLVRLGFRPEETANE